MLFFWWRKRLYSDYLEKLKQREIASLEKIIEEQAEEIHKLKHHNEELSKIIHRDNKLIPSMQIAVKTLLNSDLAMNCLLYTSYKNA